ncbi:SHQ1 protein-domain-containing protein [Mortierella sp. GBAus27b]|nr:SHQ1 protein-domain-containing protein [Mortierella sp. GBAus27b]
MITPAFTVTQDDGFVTIVIKAPHIKAQNVDIEVTGAVFKFNLKPYFLRLTFPGNIVEDERSKATYDIGAGELTVVLAKETAGEHFPDLDLLTKLLVRRNDQAQPVRKPLIEVISSGETLEGTQQVDKDEEFDWELPQEIRQEIFSSVRYGFNNRHSGFFTHVQETANDVLDVYDPEHATLETRRQNRIQRENEKFDDEYYMSDFMNEEEIQHLLKFKTQWWDELRAIQKAEKDATSKKQQSKPSSTTTPTISIKRQEPLSPSTTSASTTFRSTLLNTPSHTSTPSIFNIVKDDLDDTASSSQPEPFGLKEVSTRTISSDISDSSTAKPMILDMNPSSTPAIESLIPAEEPLIDESEPIKHLGPHSIHIIDSSQQSTGDQLESELADLSLGDGISAGAKPFSTKEQEMMRDLPRREYILENAKSTYLSLMDILFAYSYELRVTEGDSTVETAWTICKMSPTIAALDQFTTLKETMVACFRRVLAYPLYRNWNLATKVVQDVYVILKLGRRGILRALLAIKDILDHDDVYYIYSKMFIEDYCVWIQSASEKVIRTLAHELHHFQLNKSDLEWHLEELEALAKEAPEEEEDDDDDDDDTSSDSDSSSEEDSDGNDDGEKSNSKDKDTNANEEESIFMQEGPRPMIIEL